MQLFKRKSFKSEIAALINSNKEIEHIMKIDESLEEYGLLIKLRVELLKMKQKKKGGFLGMLLGTLAASLLTSAIAGKGVIRGDDGVIRVEEGVIRAGQYF